jgi:uncharacterized protein
VPAWPEVAIAGVVIGVLFGLFGVGGSSFATPVLGLLGVPGLVAVASPLPAAIAAAVAGMEAYVRRRQVEWPVARRRPAIVIPAAAAIGLFTGLLANGGGFLLVPLFVLVLGLTMPESAGTSLVVIAVLSLPTVITHWVLGHIDWSVATAFAVGSIPGAVAGSRLAHHVPADAMRRSFGLLLIGFAVFFVAHQLVAG